MKANLHVTRWKQIVLSGLTDPSKD
ncbi:hypothetical protein RHRU231_450094 [Rhodococcus ruber]|uniref:Uncharacterized protein n=1 Tax=Rhodococcus ruber TaxID=1830 RepID=A0A098BL44_9NOCA|nr:hypothetical protein RHRU231_450094 [Rhodococcus ruber]